MSLIGTPCRHSWAWPFLRMMSTTSRPRWTSPSAKIWHHRYGNGVVVNQRYAKLFAMLETLTESRKKQFSKIERLLKRGKVGGAVSLWAEELEVLRDVKVEDRLLVTEWDSKLKFLEVGYARDILASSLRLYGWDTFLRFLDPLITSHFVMEFIPQAVNNLCVHKQWDWARDVVLEVSRRSVDPSLPYRVRERLYDATMNSVNTLLDNNIRKRQWEDVVYLLQNLSIQKPLALADRVAQRLDSLPDEDLAGVYQLLLRNKTKFTRAYEPFLKALMKRSDVGCDLVKQTDRAMLQLDANSKPVFPPSMYKYILQQLSKRKDEAYTAWLMENVWLKHFPNDWGLLLYRATHVDGLETTSRLFQHIREQNIMPSRAMMLTLFDVFRMNSLEMKCVEVLGIYRKWWQLDARICVSILTLLADRYDPCFVVRLYNKLYPNTLDTLGISQYMDERGVTCATLDEPVIDADVQLAECNAALAVVYRSVLHTVEDTSTMWQLYQRYKSHPRPSLRVIDLFVTNLCKRFQNRPAINLAHDIFIDAIQTLHFKHPNHQTTFIDPQYQPRAAQMLMYHHCRDIHPISDQTLLQPANVDRAVELLNMMEQLHNTSNAGVISTAKHELYEPLIRYYRRQGDMLHAAHLVRHAESRTAVISPSLK